MKREAVLAFLNALGVDKKSITDNKEWINCRCPLSGHTHEQGDSIPSFGIAVKPDGHSFWQCFGCSPDSKRLDKLLSQIFVVSGDYPFAAAQVYVKNENFLEGGRELNLSGIKYDVWASEISASFLLPLSQKTPVPGEVLRKFPLLQNDDSEIAGRCRNFLIDERGVALWAIYYSGVRFISGLSTLIFPLTDHDGRVYQLRARRVDVKNIWTLDCDATGFEFQRIKQTGTWFGLHLVNWDRAVVLVEGEIDCLKLVTFGYFNSIASATSGVTFEQLDNLKGNAYYLGYDADKSGKRARERIIDRIGKDVQLFDLDWSLVNTRQGKPCKDSGDVPDKKSMRYIFKNARYIS